MPTSETPTDPATQPPSVQPEQAAEPAPQRIRAGRYGDIDHHELIRLLDTIEDERARGRFRESIYISFFIWIAIAWVVFYGQRYLWHQTQLRDPATVLRERELTELRLPSAPRTAPAPRPVPH